MKKFLILLFVSLAAFSYSIFAGTPCTLGGESPSLSGCNYVPAVISNGTDLTLTNGIPANSVYYDVFTGDPSLVGTYDYGQNGYVNSYPYFSQPFTLTTTNFNESCNTYPCEGLLVFMDSHGDWVNYGDTGSVSFSYDGDGHFTVTGGSARFLGFPLECSTPTCSGGENISYVTNGAYTASSVISVVDHSMTTVYGKDGVIQPFTGETFNASGVYTTGHTAPCYPKEDDAEWSELLSDVYSGTSATHDYEDCLVDVALNYDGHSGYDYKAASGTLVNAAFTGTVVNFDGQKCIPKDFSEGETCEDWGAVGIDHGNGYITQYLHLSSIFVDVDDEIIVQELSIGYSGDTAPESKPVGQHLHFEVLKLIPGQTNDYNPAHYKVVDPYGWNGEGTDPLETATGIKNTCLWVDGCQ